MVSLTKHCAFAALAVAVLLCSSDAAIVRPNPALKIASRISGLRDVAGNYLDAVSRVEGDEMMDDHEGHDHGEMGHGDMDGDGDVDKDDMVGMQPQADDMDDMMASPEPEESAEPSDEDDDDEAACFPGVATVRLADGSVTNMRDLNVGDMVEVAAGEFSPVFAFTHKVTEGDFAFVKIQTESGAQLLASEGHYIHTSGGLKPAGAVEVGDEVEAVAEGASVSTRVLSVSAGHLETGLFNPQTLHGDIVVNGVVSSTYTTAIDAPVAHALLAPLRAVYKTFGLSAQNLSHEGWMRSALLAMTPSGKASCVA